MPGVTESFGVHSLMGDIGISLLTNGAITLLACLLGFLWLMTRKKRVLTVYWLVMLFATVSQIIVAGVDLWKMSGWLDGLKGNLCDNIQTYDGQLNSTNPVSLAIDTMQVTVGCCGADNATDFNTSVWFQQRSVKTHLFPISCCQREEKNAVFDAKEYKLENKECQSTLPSKDNPNTLKACYPTFLTTLADKILSLVVLVMIVFVVEIAATSSAFSLWRNSRIQEERDENRL